MEVNPQPVADALLLDESKYLASTREDLEQGIELAAVLMQLLHPLVKDMRRTAAMRAADQTRIVALTGLLVRLIGQLRKLSDQAAADASDADVWRSIRRRAMADDEQPSGVAKKPKH
jgi:hypothetical protein